jgi:hypothetical protein
MGAFTFGPAAAALRLKVFAFFDSAGRNFLFFGSILYCFIVAHLGDRRKGSCLWIYLQSVL